MAHGGLVLVQETYLRKRVVIPTLCESTTQRKGGSYCTERASFWQSYIVADKCYTPPTAPIVICVD